MTTFLRRLRPHVFAALAVALSLGIPRVLGADVIGIGYVDQTALSSIPRFAAANRELVAYHADLDKQFAQALKGARSAADQARLAQSFQARFADRQRALLGPLFARAQVAVASVASSKNLTVVLDKRIVVYGGTDITKDVVALVTGVADPVPPVSTPLPSRVGYVDQLQIDALPKIRAAQDTFNTYQAGQQRTAQDKMRGAKTDADRSRIMAQYQSALDAEQKKVIQPLIDQEHGVIADIAKKRDLLLVVERNNVIYGGTDVTADVTAALK